MTDQAGNCTGNLSHGNGQLLAGYQVLVRAGRRISRSLVVRRHVRHISQTNIGFCDVDLTGAVRSFAVALHTSYMCFLAVIVCDLAPVAAISRRGGLAQCQ